MGQNIVNHESLIMAEQDVPLSVDDTIRRFGRSPSFRQGFHQGPTNTGVEGCPFLLESLVRFPPGSVVAAVPFGIGKHPGMDAADGQGDTEGFDGIGAEGEKGPSEGLAADGGEEEE